MCVCVCGCVGMGVGAYVSARAGVGVGVGANVGVGAKEGVEVDICEDLRQDKDKRSGSVYLDSPARCPPPPPPPPSAPSRSAHVTSVALPVRAAATAATCCPLRSPGSCEGRVQLLCVSFLAVAWSR